MRTVVVRLAASANLSFAQIKGRAHVECASSQSRKTSEPG